MYCACVLCSWGSGADLWGSEVEGRFGKPRMDDGLLEVVGVTGVVHMVRSSRDEAKPPRGFFCSHGHCCVCVCVCAGPDPEWDAFRDQDRSGELYPSDAEVSSSSAGGRGALGPATRTHHHLSRRAKGHFLLPPPTALLLILMQLYLLIPAGTYVLIQLLIINNCMIM